MNIKRIFAGIVTLAVAASSFAAFADERPQVGDNLTLGTYEESAAQTQCSSDL